MRQTYVSMKKQQERKSEEEEEQNVKQERLENQHQEKKLGLEI